jgi:hypothetical protein
LGKTDLKVKFEATDTKGHNINISTEITQCAETGVSYWIHMIKSKLGYTYFEMTNKEIDKLVEDIDRVIKSLTESKANTPDKTNDEPKQ